MGTINYMAPEQRISASRATEISDLYAVGVSLFAIITGSSNENLFDEKEQQQAFASLDEPIATFLQKACHQDPTKRHANAEEMIVELAHLKTQINPAPTDAAPFSFPLMTATSNRTPVRKICEIFTPLGLNMVQKRQIATIRTAKPIASSPDCLTRPILARNSDEKALHLIILRPSKIRLHRSHQTSRLLPQRRTPH